MQSLHFQAKPHFSQFSALVSSAIIESHFVHLAQDCDADLSVAEFADLVLAPVFGAEVLSLFLHFAC